MSKITPVINTHFRTVTGSKYLLYLFIKHTHTAILQNYAGGLKKSSICFLV